MAKVSTLIDRLLTSVPRQCFQGAGIIGIGVIIIVSVLPGDQRPHTGMPGGFEHLTAYAGTGMALALGWPALAHRVAWLGVLGMLAGLMEICQLWVPGRTTDIVDAIASTGGAGVGIVAALVADRIRSMKNPPRLESPESAMRS